ncbi:hypothetical protein C1N53_06600 [Pontibacter sp. SGAir0037]|nr:hypothetical protein C1N53_06600 [Pontibacter sp. SGAir0037]
MIMPFKKLHQYKLRFWQQWLLLAVSVWFVLNLSDTILYLYRLQTWGNYITYEDGTPVTVWQRIISHNTEGLLWLFIPFFSLLAEANYHFVFKRKNMMLFVISTFACGAAGVSLTVVVDALFNRLHSSIIDALPFAVTLSLWFLFYSILRDYIYKRINIAETLSEKSQAELLALKAQINPHFFFNTLNSLFGTALEEKAPRTAESIDQLAGIMRYTITETQQNFTLISNEIKFLEDYLHLQRLRLPVKDNIIVKKEISYDGQPYAIAPMLLIPFIENAFKYGVSIDQDCFIHIKLVVENHQLHLVVSNKVLRENTTTKGAGTGIVNAKKRLSLLYPQKHDLYVSNKENFVVDLKITFS